MMISTLSTPSGNVMSSILPLITRMTSSRDRRYRLLFELLLTLIVSVSADDSLGVLDHIRFFHLKGIRSSRLPACKRVLTAMTIFAPALAANRLNKPTPQPMSNTTLSLNSCRLFIIALRNVFVRTSSFSNSYTKTTVTNERLDRRRSTNFMHGEMRLRVEVELLGRHLLQSHLLRIGRAILLQTDAFATVRLRTAGIRTVEGCAFRTLIVGSLGSKLAIRFVDG